MYSLLRFSGVTVRHNPKELTIIKSKDIKEYTLADDSVHLRSVREKPAVIKGIGELYGNSCFDMYSHLMRMQMKNTPQKLCIPEMGVFWAVLTNIKAKAGTRENLIVIEFEFRTAGERYAEKITSAQFTFCGEGETLWDISNRCDVSVETLVSLNTDIRDILDITEGKKVRLR